ncbi:MAG: YheC/YheD family protein [Firmicutes bacterium]|nr:YheC/YheD family protein [Bacillota bacterium]
MLVGIVRNRLNKDPDRPIKERSKIYLLSMLCHFNGIESFVFYEDGVDLDNKTIKGFFFDPVLAEFVEKETRYPDIVDSDCTVRWKQPQIFESLFSNCAFIYTRRLNKERVHAILQKSDCYNYNIQSYYYKNSKLDQHILNHKTVIVKPSEGSKGRGVHKISLNLPDTKVGAKSISNMKSLFGKKYIVEVNRTKTKMSQKKFDVQCTAAFLTESHIVQEYVNSTTKEGAPFDIRVESRRGADGKWNFVRSYVKVGNKEGVVSNVAMGGFVTLGTKQFLTNEFGADSKRIYRQLMHIADKIPKVIQKSTVRFIPTITVDVGINRDNNNQIKIFEVNTGAATTNVFSVMHESCLRIDCYKYMYTIKDTLLERQSKFEIDYTDTFMFRLSGESDDGIKDDEGMISQEEVNFIDAANSGGGVAIEQENNADDLSEMGDIASEDDAYENNNINNEDKNNLLTD